MQGWLDFTALELQQVQERIDALAPKLDPDGEREWSLLHDTARRWYLTVQGDGRLFQLDGPAGESVRVLRQP